MKKIRRWTSSIASSFDWLVSQVENHDSLVRSAIEEVTEAGAKAKSQLKRVRSDGKKLVARLRQVELEIQQWQDRALKSAQEDEEKALECLRRKSRAQSCHSLRVSVLTRNLGGGFLVLDCQLCCMGQSSK